MLTVAYVLTEFPALSESFVTTEIDLLSRRGVTVVPLSYRPSQNRDLQSTTAAAWDARTHRPSTTNPGPWLRLVARHPGRAVKALSVILGHRNADWRERAGTWTCLWWCAAAAEQVQETGCSHVHTHFARGAATLAWTVATMAGLEFSFTAHAFGVHRSRPDALHRKARAASFVRITHNSLRPLLPQQARVVRLPTPLDLNEWPLRAPRPPGTPARILTVARMAPKKGISDIPAIMSQLKARVEWTVMGPGTPPTRAAGLTFVGPGSPAAVRAALLAADLFVLPCRITPDGDRDGLPVVILEAFASGVPVVSTDVAGIPELFEKAKLSHHLAAPDNLNAIARIADGLLTDMEDRNTTITAQRAAIEADFGGGVVDALSALWRTHHTPPLR